VSARVLIRFKARSWQSLELLVAFCWENDERVVKIVHLGGKLGEESWPKCFFVCTQNFAGVVGCLLLFKHVNLKSANIFYDLCKVIARDGHNSHFQGSK
jgi:hypothetical protein